MKNIFLNIEDAINDEVIEFLPGVYYAHVEIDSQIFRRVHGSLGLTRDIHSLSNFRMNLKPVILRSFHMKDFIFLLPKDFGTPISEILR